jgi:hypothetical protein
MKNVGKNSPFQLWNDKIQNIKKKFPFGPYKVYKNIEGRLHRDDGPAYISPTLIVWYQNGMKHGVEASAFGYVAYWFMNRLVPKKYILEPETLTVEEVMTQSNTEVRYAGMRIVGYEKFLNSKFVKQIHEDKEKGQSLYSISGITRQPFGLVKVVNSTPEPDGSFKDYYLTVPGNLRTCKAAVAWTFGKEEKEYQPALET